MVTTDERTPLGDQLAASLRQYKKVQLSGKVLCLMVLDLRKEINKFTFLNFHLKT